MSLTNPPSSGSLPRTRVGNLKRSIQATVDGNYLFLCMSPWDSGLSLPLQCLAKVSLSWILEDSILVVTFSLGCYWGCVHLQRPSVLLILNIGDWVHLLISTESTEAIDSRRPGGYISKVRVRDRYHIVGFISSGTYGRVYKAVGKNGKKGEFAIKKY